MSRPGMEMPALTTVVLLLIRSQTSQLCSSSVPVWRASALDEVRPENVSCAAHLCETSTLNTISCLESSTKKKVHGLNDQKHPHTHTYTHLQTGREKEEECTSAFTPTTPRIQKIHNDMSKTAKNNSLFTFLNFICVVHCTA